MLSNMASVVAPGVAHRTTDLDSRGYKFDPQLEAGDFLFFHSFIFIRTVLLNKSLEELHLSVMVKLKPGSCLRNGCSTVLPGVKQAQIGT